MNINLKYGKIKLSDKFLFIEQSQQNTTTHSQATKPLGCFYVQRRRDNKNENLHLPRKSSGKRKAMVLERP
jgi:hypothetical protein